MASDYCHLLAFGCSQHVLVYHPATVSNGYWRLIKSFTGSLGLNLFEAIAWDSRILFTSMSKGSNVPNPGEFCTQPSTRNFLCVWATRLPWQSWQRKEVFNCNVYQLLNSKTSQIGVTKNEGKNPTTYNLKKTTVPFHLSHPKQPPFQVISQHLPHVVGPVMQGCGRHRYRWKPCS